MTILYIIIALIVCVFAGTVFAGLYFYRYAVVRSDEEKRTKNYWERDIEPNPKFDEAECALMLSGSRFIKQNISEEVSIESHDGLRLVGHIVEPPNPRGVFLLVHGYRSHAVNDFSCAVIPMYNMGFATLLIDHRAHGYSEGGKIGFGALERYDVVRWAEFAEKRWGKPIILDGVSMGASTVMMAAELDLPKSVRAIIADCGYTTPEAICRRVMRKWFKLRTGYFFHVANIFVKLFAKYDLKSVDSRRGLKKAAENGLSILVAHGEADDFVPYSMALENFSAVEGYDGAELFSSESADHGEAFLRNYEEYMDAIGRIIKKIGA